MTLLATGIQKRYAGHLVLDVDHFEVAPGEVVALLGENGAGKSTLAKCLAGAVRADVATISVDGRMVELTSPRAASQAGIAFVPQELAEVPELTAAENIVLGRWPTRFGAVDRRRMRELAGAQLRSFGVELDLDQRMSALRIGDRQVVEICRVFGRRSSYVLLDEPTAALDRTEADRLFAIVRSLAGQGVGVVFVSHRLDEIARFSDRVDVMRNGRRVASLPTGQTSRDELIELMLGGEAPRETRRATSSPPTAALSVCDWRSDGPVRLQGVDIAVGFGEILGVFGVRGSGADVLAEGLAGQRHDIRGTMEVNGRQLACFGSPRQARRHGLASVPADRKRSGLVLGMSIASNITLGTPADVSRLGVLSRRRERRVARAAIEDHDVRCSSARQPVGELSGGNQQKVLLASRLITRPSVLIVHEPTRGVDVGARAHLHGLIRERSESGTAVMLISTDVEEVVNVSDRVIVIRDGLVVGELTGDELTQTAVIALATKADPR